MVTTLIFLSLMASTFGQLIYPDEYNRLRNLSTIPSDLYSNFAISITKSNSVNLQPPLTSLQPESQNAPMYPAEMENTLQGWSDHVNNIIINGVLKFALDVERQIYRTRDMSLMGQKDNIIFSPISLTVTLAIVFAGSAGRTFNEVSKVLGLESGIDISQNSEIVHQMFGLLLTKLHTKVDGSPGPRVDFATATYVQDGFPILPQFKALSNNVYENELINVDFIRKGKAAMDIINTWVNQKTMGKISKILDDVPSPNTMMILLSALYFNGEWNQHFLTGFTKKALFHVEPNESILVDTMYNAGTFPFYENKQLGVKILGLPYKGHEISMYILLPKNAGVKALREFQNKLTVDIIENLVKNMKNETCIISMPRMKLSSTLHLEPVLAALGMKSLFDPELADLSLISQGKNKNNQNRITTKSRSNRTNTQNQQNYEDFISSRISSIQNEKMRGRMMKRNSFTYEDKLRGYSVEQWINGFSIRKIRNVRDVKEKKDRNLYRIEEKTEENNNHAKVINLEENKYHFQENKQRGRNRRQTRPINQDFLNYIKQKNFPSFGLDDLRNSGNLVNPHLFASKVLQKVEIDITEKGTEAAVVTSIVLERDGNQKRLIANRPFIFFIRHDPTRLVFFWGTLNVPTPNYQNT